MSVTTIEVAIHSLFDRCYEGTTVIFNFRRCWLDYLSDALYTHGTVRRYIKVFRNHVVSETPCVVGTINIVCVNEGGISAAIGDVAGIDAFLERNNRAAVGDNRQGGSMDIRNTVNRSGIVGCWRETFRIQCVGESPDGVMLCTIGITEAEDHRTCTIGMNVGSAIHEDRHNGITTYILNDLCGWTTDIGQAGHGGVAIIRHSSNVFWQGNMEGEVPGMRIVGAVCIWIVVYDVTLASVES